MTISSRRVGSGGQALSEANKHDRRLSVQSYQEMEFTENLPIIIRRITLGWYDTFTTIGY
jgi:hypothetical protein